jgi:hypothetical protein
MLMTLSLFGREVFTFVIGQPDGFELVTNTGGEFDPADEEEDVPFGFASSSTTA